MSSLKKVVYVLVSQTTDHFTEMCLLSIECMKRYSPGLYIELVMDEKTKHSLVGYRGKVLTLVDNYHVLGISGDNNGLVSRMIKTQLRSIVEGDYLYIDIDAFPMKKLDSIYDSQYDISMVYDMNVSPDKFIFHDYEREIFDVMQWELPKEYFNSGVMFVKDNERVHRFYENWYSIWSESSKGGLHKDQPPMHEAIRVTKIKVGVLEPVWNVLVTLHKGRVAKNAKIYHVSTVRFDERNDTHFHSIIREMKLNERINWNLLEAVRASKYPWTNHSSLKLNWGVGNYKVVAVLIFKKVMSLGRDVKL